MDKNFPQGVEIIPRIDSVGRPPKKLPDSREKLFNLGVEMAMERTVTLDASLRSKELPVYEIRSYDQVLHPDLFRNGGVLGLVIRVLNFLRWKLEVLVQYLVIRHGMNVEKLSPPARRKVLEAFWYDVRQEALQRVATSPTRAFDLPLAQPVSAETTPGQVSDNKPGRDIIELIREYGPQRGKRRAMRRYVAMDVVEEADGPEEDDAWTQAH